MKLNKFALITIFLAASTLLGAAQGFFSKEEKNSNEPSGVSIRNSQEIFPDTDSYDPIFTGAVDPGGDPDEPPIPVGNISYLSVFSMVLLYLLFLKRRKNKSRLKEEKVTKYIE